MRWKLTVSFVSACMILLACADTGMTQVRQIGSTTMIEAQGMARVESEYGAGRYAAFSADVIRSSAEASLLAEIRLTTESEERLTDLPEGQYSISANAFGDGWVRIRIWGWGEIRLLSADPVVRTALMKIVVPNLTWVDRAQSRTQGDEFVVSIGPQAEGIR